MRVLPLLLFCLLCIACPAIYAGMKRERRGVTSPSSTAETIEAARNSSSYPSSVISVDSRQLPFSTRKRILERSLKQPSTAMPFDQVITQSHIYQITPEEYERRQLNEQMVELFLEVSREAVDRKKFKKHVRSLFSYLNYPETASQAATFLQKLFNFHDGYGNQPMLLEMIKYPSLIGTVFTPNNQLSFQRSCQEYSPIIFDHVCRAEVESLSLQVNEFCMQRAHISMG